MKLTNNEGFLFLPSPHPTPSSHQLRPDLQWRSGRGFLHPLLSLFFISFCPVGPPELGMGSKEEEIRSCSHTWLVCGWYYLQFFLGTYHALYAILGSFPPWGTLQCTVY